MPTQVFTASPAYNHQYSVSGGSGYHLSGMSSASATTSGLNGYNSSGPWLIEEQSMSIDYFRTPAWVTRQNVTSQDFALSGGMPDSIVSGNLGGSKISARVEAYVKRVKTYDTYQTSSYNQPQRFTVSPNSTDINGLSYGTITVGKLGPAGSITTTQKYYNRRPWVEGIDSTYDKAAIGFTWYHRTYAHVSSMPGVFTASTVAASYRDQQPALGDFSQFLGERWAFSEIVPMDSSIGTTVYVFPYSHSNMGWLLGGYNVANEQTTLATEIIDQCGRFFEWGGAGLYNHDYASQDGTHSTTWELFDAYQGSLRHYDGTPSEYSISRHDFS